ncbi:MAG: DUF5009 domain-containing protein [Planctomycetaceae bacterium]
MTQDAITQSQHVPSARVVIVDQLRGLWVVVSAMVILLPATLREWFSDQQASWLQNLLEPSIWHGCTLRDLVNPGFLFVAGASIGLSLTRRHGEGQPGTAMLKHLSLRTAYLFLLGLVIDGGLLSLQWPWRFSGIFQQIALCRLGAGIFEILAGWKASLLLAGLILFNYGAVLEMGPELQMAPSTYPQRGKPPDAYSVEYNLAANIDRSFLPGRKYFGAWDPQGILVTLPALALALLGAGSSCLLLRHLTAQNWIDSWGTMAFVGLALLQIGVLWSWWQPFNAWLLTPPVVLVAAGAGLVVLGALARIQRFSILHHSLALLKRIGQNCLGLMVGLHLIDHFGFLLVSSVAPPAGLMAGMSHTLVAVMAMLGFCAVDYGFRPNQFESGSLTSSVR